MGLWGTHNQEKVPISDVARTELGYLGGSDGQVRIRASMEMTPIFAPRQLRGAEHLERQPCLMPCRA